MSFDDSIPARVDNSTLVRAALVFLGFAVVFALLNTGSGTMAKLIAPAADPGWSARIAAALVLSAIVTANVVGLRFLNFQVQVILVWIQLIVLALVFFASFNLSYGFILNRLPFLITQGAFTTIYISLVAIAISCVIALIGALAKLSGNGIAYGIATFYISFFRGTPLLLQVYLIYLGLPQLGFIIDAVPAGIIALSLCYGAYMAEIFRSGIQAVPKGQAEAGRALGLHGGLIMRKIVLPQALKIIVPPTGNQFIAMLKDSSLVSVMGVWELMFLARTQGKSEFKHMEMLITAAIVYWIISMIFEAIQSRIEKHYGKADVR
ncbi:amino acid ABC transporter permease [Rhodobium gokarnense]|uniref:Polar amino acid transport system permease protein n=1 Tax=Rhodobium gokarnense TaxID=364296 RepID=A0ABT3HBM1_9HYPH|nr:amino acid ABC transporter permease [Rhodobium gokarnense]MCW2307808.1 polar amino acid transport system permease protein [Rhodobium gokarnense]